MEAALDYTLWDAAVTDKGEVIGYAYQNGIDGRGPRPSELHIVVLDQPARNASRTPRTVPTARVDHPAIGACSIRRMDVD
jgi:hypothetical protein